MSNKNSNTTKIAIKTLVDFLFKSIERSQYALNQSYNKNHIKRDLFATYLLDKNDVSATNVLNSINKPGEITEIITNMKKSLENSKASMPDIITDKIINNTLQKLDALLAAATETKPVSAVYNIKSKVNNTHNNSSAYTRIVSLLIRKLYPTDISKKTQFPFPNQKLFENYIKTDDVPAEDVLFFTTEQINGMIDVVNQANLTLPDSVKNRLTKKLEALRNERAAKNALNNLNERLNAEEKAIADKEESALRNERAAENALKKLNERLNAEGKEASGADLEAVFDNNDLHKFIKDYMPDKTALLLKSLKLTVDIDKNNNIVNKFITIITTIKNNAGPIADKIKELLKTKHGLSTNETPDNIINQLIQHYKTKYCNVTADTPLNEELHKTYTELTKRESQTGGSKCRTKRRKLSKRLQTKKRRV